MEQKLSSGPFCIFYNYPSNLAHLALGGGGKRLGRSRSDVTLPYPIASSFALPSTYLFVGALTLVFMLFRHPHLLLVF